QDVARAADVISSHGEDGVLWAGAALRKVPELAVVPVTLRQGRGEEGRIRGHADNVAVSDQERKLPAGEELTGQVIEPDRHAQRGQLSKRIVLCHVRPPVRDIAGQEMTASIVFFSALGCAGVLGAFARACSSSAPSTWSC